METSRLLPVYFTTKLYNGLNQTENTMNAEYTQTITLAECNSMLRAIATAMVKQYGEYLCVISGVKTRVIA